MLALVWGASAAYVGSRLTRGWVPHDEGTLGESAVRVQAGQLPHRDYDEIYTGGLAYVDALAFRVFGANLVAPRIVLYLAFLVWVPAVFSIAARFAPPIGAGSLTLVAVAWSVPNYTAAMPSWFNLFAATIGTAAILRFIVTSRRRWLAAAGACAAASCLVKIVGAYFVAGVLLFLVFREQEEAPAGDRGRAYGAAITLALIAFVLVIVRLVWQRLGPREAAMFVAPGAAVAGLIVWREWTGRRAGGWARVARLWRLGWPFLAGVALPIVVFLLPFARGGGLGDLWRGVFVTPLRRVTFATQPLPALTAASVTLLLAVLLGFAPRWNPAMRRQAAWGVAAVLLGAVVTGWYGPTYRAAWNSVRWLVPVAVLAGVGLLGTRAASSLPSTKRQQVMLLIAVAGVTSLVQFPFGAPIYALYVAPLGLLAAAAVVTSLTWRPGALAPYAGPLLGFYLVFALRWVHPGFIYNFGNNYAPEAPTAALAIDRGGLRIPPPDAALYEQLVTTVRAHARGVYGYATPDCPEVYFLTGLRNPTRTLFDFFDDSAGRTARILEALVRDSVRVIVVNRAPGFSAPPPPDLMAALVARYPTATSISRFDVRWRE
ncbi:MAG TPA: hypothetical protein VI160_01250 [Gemmatimonadales bacterium]